jgi:hypothetical protein
MSRETNQQHRRTTKDQDAVAKYLAALEEVYPTAKGAERVFTRGDNRIIVSVPLPKLVGERMRLFDGMAEIGTKLLLETGQYIVLSGY